MLGVIGRARYVPSRLPSYLQKQMPYTELRSNGYFGEPQALSCACTGETPVPPVDCEMVLQVGSELKKDLLNF
jgi:hypothetical protein